MKIFHRTAATSPELKERSKKKNHKKPKYDFWKKKKRSVSEVSETHAGVYTWATQIEESKIQARRFKVTDGSGRQ